MRDLPPITTHVSPLVHRERKLVKRLEEHKNNEMATHSGIIAHSIVHIRSRQNLLAVAQGRVVVSGPP